jgi:hypothetical protein
VAPAQPGDVVVDAFTREIVEQQDGLSLGQEPIGDVRADETGAAVSRTGSLDRRSRRRPS